MYYLGTQTPTPMQSPVPGKSRVAQSQTWSVPSQWSLPQWPSTPPTPHSNCTRAVSMMSHFAPLQPLTTGSWQLDMTAWAATITG